MLPRVFISYSRADETFARQLATSLSETGMDVWIDVEDIPAGMKWSSAIQQGLDSAAVMIVVISPESMSSNNVEDEWQYFLDHRKPVIPVFLRPAKIHFQLNRIQYIDFHSQPYGTALLQLYNEFRRKGIELETLRNVQDRPPVSHVPPPEPVQPQRIPQQSRETLIGARAPSAPAPASRPAPVRQPGVDRSMLYTGIAVGGVVVVSMIILLLVLSNRQPTDNSAAILDRATQTQAPVPTTQAPPVVNAPPTTEAPPPTAIPTTEVPTATPPPEIALGYPGRPVSQNSDWRWVYGAGGLEGMVLVPAGQFVMGGDNNQLQAGIDLCPNAVGQGNCRGLVQDEGPQVTLRFDRPFWIDITEYPQPGSRLPQDNVTWLEAQQICQSLGKRLPTEAEWEYAARGPDGLLFPWGNQFDSSRLNICDRNCSQPWAVGSYDDGYGERAPVGSYPAGASWVGALDMAGNLWEWTSTIYRSYPYDPRDGRENPGDQRSPRTLRGSSWNWIALDARTIARDDPVQASSPWYGFRCVRDWQDGDPTR